MEVPGRRKRPKRELSTPRSVLRRRRRHVSLHHRRSTLDSQRGDDLILPMPRIPLATALSLLALVVVVLTTPSPASAKVTRKKAMWGPVEVNGVSQFPTYARLGVGIYETQLRWNDIAVSRPQHPRDPTDPAYRWPAEIDRAVSEGRRYGIAVSLAVYGSPAWANGGRAKNWAPRRPGDLASFFEAASRRY